MRLGGFFRAECVQELDPLCERLDAYGLAALPAPSKLAEMSDADCAAFGDRARDLGLLVAEAGFWQNLLTPDVGLRQGRIERVRTMLRKADLLGCRCVVTLVGTRDVSDHPLAPHSYLFTDACRAEFREIVLRILDGLELKSVRYALEPWCNTFFYSPENVRAFLDSVGHPSLALHLDQMNMVGPESYFDTTGLIRRTFALLADRVAAAHLKDIRWDFRHLFLKLDEVHIGEGVMDYETYLGCLARLDPDTPCLCEHWKTEKDYALDFERLHGLAEKAGLRFLRRSGIMLKARNAAPEGESWSDR